MHLIAISRIFSHFRSRLPHGRFVRALAASALLAASLGWAAKAAAAGNATLTISGSPATTAVANQHYSFTPTTINHSGRALTFSASGKPFWSTLNAATGQLSGTPTMNNLGAYRNIIIIVSDGLTSTSLPAFTIDVTATNSGSGGSGTGGGGGSGGANGPTIAGMPATSVVAGQSYAFTPSTTDPSGKTLSFTISNKPSWASFNASTGQLSGTPTAAQVGSYAGIGIAVSDGSSSATLAPFSITVSAATTTTVAGAPVVLYTDVLSGPNSGGENNQGAYLSIFGKNFGSTGLGSTVKVTIGGVAVNNYRYLGASLGRPDIQQISVQVGALGNPTPGSALPIQVTVNGVASNTDQTFTVNPGRMLFVDNVQGNDATAVPGDITHPYRHVQTGDLSQGAWGQLRPGDTIV